MQLRNAIGKIEGLAFILNGLDIQSGLARMHLLETEFMIDAGQIEVCSAETEKMCRVLDQSEMRDAISDIQIKLAQVRDINGTIDRLFNSNVLDDIELFEIKHFCLLSEEIRILLINAGINVMILPDLNPVISILDPDRQKIPQFYVYDSYSEELTQIRSALKIEKKAFNATHENDPEKIRQAEERIQSLFSQSVDVEDEIRTKISSQLSAYKESILFALDKVALLDILIAKAFQIKKIGLVKPTVSSNGFLYKNIFNPYIKENLEQEGKKYQAVDISVSHYPCLVTGANMAGKTVLLKTILLSQYLFQFGFFVPATYAEIEVVDEICVSIDDEQNDLKGLSSFAAEMLNINEMTKAVIAGKRVLILIDELARTTNPHEGKAIVNGMIEFLAENQALSIITTHYSGITAACKKLKVKGFIEKDMGVPLTRENINDFIDYSLVEDENEEIPMEAMRIASILGVNERLLNKMRSYL